MEELREQMREITGRQVDEPQVQQSTTIRHPGQRPLMAADHFFSLKNQRSETKRLPLFLYSSFFTQIIRASFSSILCHSSPTFQPCIPPICLPTCFVDDRRGSDEPNENIPPLDIWNSKRVIMALLARVCAMPSGLHD
ncbi:hypothetical protein CBL_10454 [Carabus blaptoides fortunei]